MSRRRLNLLALPKNKEFWKNIVAPAGWLIANDDVVALEPNVLTHLSKGENLMKIYGKGRHNCGYLYAASFVPDMRDEILAVYNPEGASSDEELEEIKVILAKPRKRIKGPYLGWQYGLGPEKLSSDIGIPFEEAKTLLTSINSAFPEKDKYHERLLAEWISRGGFVMNGRGRPISCIDKNKKKKDLVNKVVQSTGHDLLLRLLYHRWQYIRTKKLDVLPYIPDFHDEANNLVRPDDQDKYIEACNYSYDRLNDELNWDVTIRPGAIKFSTNMSVRC